MILNMIFKVPNTTDAILVVQCRQTHDKKINKLLHEITVYTEPMATTHCSQGHLELIQFPCTAIPGSQSDTDNRIPWHIIVCQP